MRCFRRWPWASPAAAPAPERTARRSRSRTRRSALVGVDLAAAIAAIAVCLHLSADAAAQDPPPPRPPHAESGQTPAPGQTSKPGQKPDPGDTKPATPDDTVKEVGGRLVVTGDTVVVTADPDRPATESSIATKTDTPLRETPRSVSVTDRRTLDDRVAIAIADAHDYTVGMTAADDRGPAFSRGFRVDFYDLRRDGLRTYAWSVREPIGLERVQYLRGPASVLYGDGSPGGLVNLVLKKPLPVQRTELSVAIGTTGFKRLTGDVTGPIGSTPRWRYRIVGATEGLEGGFDNDERRLSLLPMAAVDLTDRVTLNLDAELYHQKGRNYWHMVPVTPDTQHGDFSHIPWDLNVASPDDDWSGWNVSPGVRLDARIGARSSLHAAARYTRIGGDLDIQALLGLAADGRTMDRYAYREISTWDEYQSDTFAVTRLTTGRVDHTIVAGIEAGLSTADSEIGTGEAPAIDLFQPVYGTRATTPTLRPTRYDVLRLGTYVQDQIALHQTVHVVPSLRWSRLTTEDRVAAQEGLDAVTHATEVSPGLGLVWLPRPSWSLYASASGGFEPPAPGRYRGDGQPLDPAGSQSVEGGVKLSLLGGRLSASGAVYRIRRTNVSEADGRGFYSQIAEGRSHGVEIEATGGLGPELGVQAAYAWMRTEVARDAAGFAGNELPNAPHNAGSLWLRYRPAATAWLRRLMLSGGIVYVSDRYLAASNTAIVPAYTRVDTSGSLSLTSRLLLRVGAQNIGNARYATTGAGMVLYAGSSRRVVVQIVTGF